MEKFNKITNIRANELELEQNYIKALENNSFKSMIKNLNLEDEVAKKYTSRLMDVLEEFENCKKCTGLCECKNSLKGYLLLARQNKRMIDFSYIMCNYSKNVEYKNNLTLFDIPKSIKNACIKDIYTNDKNRIEIIKEIKKYIINYNDEKKEKAIYLHGSFGSGKTYIIAAMFNELAKKNVKSVIIHVPELLRSLKDSFSTNYSEKFELLKKTPLLLLDDIGAEYLTSWGRDEVIEPILQYRMDEGLPTFFTSNFTLEELEKHFSIVSNGIDKVKAKRIIERIKQLSFPIELISKNLRN